MVSPASSLADLQLGQKLQAAAKDRGLSREAAIRLLEPSAPLEPLLAAAAELRDRGKGKTVTYSRKVFLPLTNLCRDRCGYCTFRRDPGDPDGWIMTPEQVLSVVEEGARLGCTEALFSLGDAPEAVFPEARSILQGLGYRRTLEYLRAACALVLERSPLFPHANAGVMGEPDLRALKPLNASLGLMLESASPRLLEPGGPHHGAVTKHPRIRLRVIELAGQLKIPFTTGLLIGIGETAEERVDSLLAIRAIHERYGHIQEVIIQNFRAKPTIPMRDHPEPRLEEMLRTTAVARLILGPSMNLQAPPNLTQDYGRLLDAGINDWGGVSPLTRDFINPEAPWPHLEDLRRATETRGYVLRQRLPVYPEYIRERPEYLPPELAERIRAAVDSDGLVPESGNSKPTTDPPSAEQPDNFELSVVGFPLKGVPMETTVLPCDGDTAVRSASPTITRILDRALEGRELTREEGLILAEMGPESLPALTAVADEIRRIRVGDIITYVVNRNINFTNICIIGCKFCAFSTGPNAADAYDLSFEEIARRATEAWERGATEVCVQGGLPRELEGTHYRDILRAVKRATPEMHIHAFSPMEVVYGVEKTGMPLPDYLAMLRAEGLGSLPGTAAEILDDDVRQLLSRKKVTVKQWVDVITTAHRLGIPTTSTMMYGHVEQPVHWINQLCLLRDIQKDTGGFTEFVPLGFIHFNTDLFQQGGSRPGPTVEEHLKVHALARLMLQGVIDNIQVSWVKLGRELSQRCLQVGANDYSGTLMEENISRLAGATAGQYLSPEEFHARIRELGRIPAERSTTYKLLKVFPRDGQ